MIFFTPLQYVCSGPSYISTEVGIQSVKSLIVHLEKLDRVFPSGATE